MLVPSPPREPALPTEVCNAAAKAGVTGAWATLARAERRLYGLGRIGASALWGALSQSCRGRPHYMVATAWRSSWALSATTTVLKDMKSAPTAGESRMPHGARAPAAKGRAITL